MGSVFSSGRRLELSLHMQLGHITHIDAKTLQNSDHDSLSTVNFANARIEYVVSAGCVMSPLYSSEPIIPSQGLTVMVPSFALSSKSFSA